jgi:hypothetical protein
MNCYERFFGSAEKAAKSLVKDAELNRSWYSWVEGGGASLCKSISGRGNRKTHSRIKAFTMWLGSEYVESDASKLLGDES